MGATNWAVFQFCGLYERWIKWCCQCGVEKERERNRQQELRFDKLRYSNSRSRVTRDGSIDTVEFIEFISTVTTDEVSSPHPGGRNDYREFATA